MATFEEFMDLDIRVGEIEQGSEQGSEQGNSVQKKGIESLLLDQMQDFWGM